MGPLAAELYRKHKKSERTLVTCKAASSCLFVSYNPQMPFDRELVEAKIALELIASADMPSVGLDALEAGLDGPAIRRLAVLERPTYFEVRDILPRAMEELGLSQLPRVEAALRIARRIAHESLQSGDPLQHLCDLESLWGRVNYARELHDVGTLNDWVEVAQSIGQTDLEIREWVSSILNRFIKLPETR
jgi:hypothetical protein